MEKVEFRTVKPEIRILGLDDGSFEPHSGGQTCLVGAILRGNHWIEGLLVDEVEIDGMDSTSTVIDMINESRHKEQLRIILTSGITFAGFNVLDIGEVFKETGLPVVVVSRDKPDLKSINEALKNLEDWERRWDILRSAGDVMSVETVTVGGAKSVIYIQARGIGGEDAKEVVRMSSRRSSIPEPLRVAHLIATGISLGESVGRV